MLQDLETLVTLLANLGAAGILSVLCAYLVLSLKKRVDALEGAQREKLEKIATDSTAALDANTKVVDANTKALSRLEKLLGPEPKAGPPWPGALGKPG